MATEPTAQQLQLAFRNLRRPHLWPATLEEALAHPTLGVCLRNAARQLGRPTWTGKASTGAPPPVAPRTPAPVPQRALPAVDFKRLAANDRDDADEAPAPSPVPSTPPTPLRLTREPLPSLSLDQARRVFRCAVQSMIETIESECPSLTLQGQRWYDTRAMLNPYEHCPEIIDLNGELLGLAQELGVTIRHPGAHRPYLVRMADLARGL